MASDQEEFLEELVGEGMMSQEEANGFWWQNWEEQTRATVGEELEEFVESGELSREQADGFLEETMRMRMAELPHPPATTPSTRRRYTPG